MWKLQGECERSPKRKQFLSSSPAALWRKRYSFERTFIVLWSHNHIITAMAPFQLHLQIMYHLWVSVGSEDWDTSCRFPSILTWELQSCVNTIKCMCACKYLWRTALCAHPLSVCSGHVWACSLVCVRLCVYVCTHVFFESGGLKQGCEIIVVCCLRRN